MPDPAAGVDRAQLLLTVLDEGRRTATYKLAVLLALLDCCTVTVDSSGRASDVIRTRALAERVVELYYGQVRPWHGPEGPKVLRQSTQARAVTPDAVAALRRQTAAPSAAAARYRDPALWEETVRTVELNLVQMPLGKLQRPAGWSAASGVEYPRFLYEDSAFRESVSRRALDAEPWSVRLHPGIGDWLVSLSGLVRPLVELHWTRAVVQINRLRLVDDHVAEHLFGARRTALSALRDGLREAQDGRCFYCELPLRGTPEVDHVVPWSRLPNDALGNLVLADRACNGSKSDHLAAVPLLQRWQDRDPVVLQQLADATGWPLEQARSWQVARGVYSHLPPATPLWEARGVFALLERPALEELLARPLTDGDHEAESDRLGLPPTQSDEDAWQAPPGGGAGVAGRPVRQRADGGTRSTSR